MSDSLRIARTVALVLAAVALSGCVAQPAAAPTTPSLGGGPRALVREPARSFGTVEPGTFVRERFEVMNVGDQPLDLLGATASCGCTAMVVSDQTVWPGKTGAVEVSLDTVGLAGRQVKAVRLRTSDPSVAELPLTLYGDVVADVNAEPKQLYFGRVARGEVATGVVNVVVLRPEVQITGASSESGQLDVAVAPLDAPQQGVRLIVTPRMNGGDGPFSDKVVVTTTSSRQPKLAIPVLASVEEGAPRRSASRGAGTATR